MHSTQRRPSVTDPLININDLSVSFGDKLSAIQAVSNVSFRIEHGETLALVGESGSGKSVTALSIMQLLPYPMAFHPSGSIRFLDEEIIGSPSSRMQEIRGNRIAIIFQEPLTSLNPLHTIEKQIGETLLLHKKLDRSATRSRIIELLCEVGLPNARERLVAYPHQLSGGQRQRVAMGRAIVRNPEAFLMDEPLSNLDAKLRVQMRAELGQLHTQLETTTLYVTHDQVEAMTMGDRVAVIRKGELQQIDTPREIYLYPKNIFVAGFIGSPSMNFVYANVKVSSKNITLKFGEDSIKCNADGTCVSILSERMRGTYLRAPDTRLHVYHCEMQSVLHYDFAEKGRYPVAHFWDDDEPRLLACETHKLRGSTGSSGSQSKNGSSEKKEEKI